MKNYQIKIIIGAKLSFLGSWDVMVFRLVVHLLNIKYKKV